MILKSLYVIYDEVSRESIQVFFANNDSSALRTFNSAIPQNVNKDDFALYLVATIDMEAPRVLQIERSKKISVDNTSLDVPDNPAPVVSAEVAKPSVEDLYKMFLSMNKGGNK